MFFQFYPRILYGTWFVFLQMFSEFLLGGRKFFPWSDKVAAFSLSAKDNWVFRIFINKVECKK